MQQQQEYPMVEKTTMGSPFVGTPTMQMIQCPQQQMTHPPQQAEFQHPNVRILNFKSF